MTEFTLKQDRILALLDRHNLDALLLKKVSSFAWATCGAASYINTASSEGVASLLITRTGRYLLTNNIEATRLEQEEKLKDQGWDFHIAPWYSEQNELDKLTKGLRLGADGPHSGASDLSAELGRLRTNLLPPEVERFRYLGSLCAKSMNSAIHVVRPGYTEHEIAGLLAHESESRGVQPIVNLIATDERIFSFRHPLPTSKRLERYAMLVLCGRRAGLVCSLTRLVYFGRMSDELRRKAEAVAQIDATYITATRPASRLNEIMEQAKQAYKANGFPDEWKLHHQGGPAGYEPREFVAIPEQDYFVIEGQVYAWNPSIAGTKSEDTILIGEKENEVITEISGWPTITVMVDGKPYNRPAVLEVK